MERIDDVCTVLGSQNTCLINLIKNITLDILSMSQSFLGSDMANNS